jgi:hypothetical protein
MTAIRKSLKPGGRVVLVEYRKEDPKVPIKEVHKMSEEQIKKEMAVVGLSPSEDDRGPALAAHRGVHEQEFSRR